MLLPFTPSLLFVLLLRLIASFIPLLLFLPPITSGIAVISMNPDWCCRPMSTSHWFLLHPSLMGSAWDETLTVTHALPSLNATESDCASQQLAVLESLRRSYTHPSHHKLFPLPNPFGKDQNSRASQAWATIPTPQMLMPMLSIYFQTPRPLTPSSLWRPTSPANWNFTSQITKLRL